MIKVQNVQNENEYKYIDKHELKEWVIKSLPDGMYGHYNDGDFFFTHVLGVNPGYLKYVAEATDKKKYYELVNELIEEGAVFPNFDTLSVEDGIEDLYKNKIVSNRDLAELVNLDRLASLMMGYKCKWLLFIDDEGDFTVDLADVDYTEANPEPKTYSVGDTVKLKNGRTGIIEDYDDKYYYVKDNNTNLTKIRKMRDGAWELPFTIKQAQDLYDLLYTDKFADKEPMEVLYGLFGDDDLFDALYRGFSKGTVVRFVKRLINDYKERPNNYFVKPEKGVLEILEKIVKDYE